MGKRTHAQLKKIALSRPGIRKAYDLLEEEFELLNEMLKARKKARKTQKDVAKVMKTTTSVIGRLETGGGQYRHSPRLTTLRNYARAINCRLRIGFVPEKSIGSTKRVVSARGKSHSTNVRRDNKKEKIIV